MTWISCQNSGPTPEFGVHALVGVIYTYVYAAGSLKVTPNNNFTPPEFAVTDCAIFTLNLLDVVAPVLIPMLSGRIDFGGGYGYTPCSLVSIEPSTWSKIKSKYMKSD